MFRAMKVHSIHAFSYREADSRIEMQANYCTRPHSFGMQLFGVRTHTFTVCSLRYIGVSLPHQYCNHVYEDRGQARLLKSLVLLVHCIVSIRIIL